MEYVEFIKLMLSDVSFNAGVLVGFIFGCFYMGWHKDKEIKNRWREIEDKNEQLDKAERRRVEELEDKRKEIKELKEEIASLKIALSVREFKS